MKRSILLLAIIVGLATAEARAQDSPDKKVQQLEARVKLLEAVIEVREKKIAELQEEIDELHAQAEPASAVTEEATTENNGTEAGEGDEVGEEGEPLADEPGPQQADDDPAAATKAFGLAEIDTLIKAASGQSDQRRKIMLGTAAGNEFRLRGTVICMGQKTAESPEGDETEYAVELDYESAKKIVKRGPGRRGTGASTILVYPGPILSSTPRQQIHIRANTSDRPDCSPGNRMVVTGTITSITIDRTTGAGDTFCWTATIQGEGCQFVKKR